MRLRSPGILPLPIRLARLSGCRWLVNAQRQDPRVYYFQRSLPPIVSRLSLEPVQRIIQLSGVQPNLGPQQHDSDAIKTLLRVLCSNSRNYEVPHRARNFSFRSCPIFVCIRFVHLFFSYYGSSKLDSAPASVRTGVLESFKASSR